MLSRLASAAMLATAVFPAFLVLGFLTIGPDIIKSWTKVAPHEIFGITTNGIHRHMLSWEHLKVAGFLATFSGFNFALVSASDARLREAVNDSAGDLVREASAVRPGPRHEIATADADPASESDSCAAAPTKE
ncbi:hypothetical protein J5M86_12320 [Yimella sp. cx-51]|uniref:hypothetical protein n=1 Tax=Yimella sp. cx-51 TaxID=2770551 RepID=UPI00165D9AC8|nr:hypothetical protein [Yimella sp. cx-51]MBC9955809.1 hypothetical protein [Yimella sp. cx-51]QTH37638.1 hypothetical protein J5M86_12320 [Yimella sp. cx-51]